VSPVQFQLRSDDRPSLHTLTTRHFVSHRPGTLPPGSRAADCLLRPCLPGLSRSNLTKRALACAAAMRAPVVSTLHVSACHGAVSALLPHAQCMSPAKVHEKGLTPPVLCGTQCAPPPPKSVPQHSAQLLGQANHWHCTCSCICLGSKNEGRQPQSICSDAELRRAEPFERHCSPGRQPRH